MSSSANTATCPVTLVAKEKKAITLHTLTIPATLAVLTPSK